MRVLMFSCGLVVLLAGVIVLPTPLPLGLPLLALGAALVLTASPAMRQHFKAWRSRNPHVCARLQAMERNMPKWLRKALEETRGSGNV